MSTNELDYYYKNACEYTIPIRLNVPLFLEPKVFVKPTPCVTQKIPVQLEPEILMQPEVKAAPPVCIPQKEQYKHQEELPAYEG